MMTMREGMSFNIVEPSETLQRKKFRVLEVGCGELPITDETHGRKDAIYVGIDIDKEPLIKNQAGNQEPNVFFVQAQGENVPLADRSVNQVYFTNVFGDDEIAVNSKLAFLKEAYRVLKATGVVAVLEFYSPNEARNLRINDRSESLVKLFKAGGFSQVEVGSLKRNKRHREFFEKLFLSSLNESQKAEIIEKIRRSYRPFILVARKSKQVKK